MDPDTEGGNYWDDFDQPGEGAYDEYQGSNQNVLTADQIVDLGPPNGGKNPYLILGGAGAQDDYPFIVPL